MRNEDDYKLDKAHYIPSGKNPFFKDKEAKQEEDTEELEKGINKAITSLYRWGK